MFLWYIALIGLGQGVLIIGARIAEWLSLELQRSVGKTVSNAVAAEDSYIVVIIVVLLTECSNLPDH